MWHAFNPSAIADCAELRRVQQTRSCARQFPNRATNIYSRYSSESQVSRVPGSTVVPSSWFASKPGKKIKHFFSAAAGL